MVHRGAAASPTCERTSRSPRHEQDVLWLTCAEHKAPIGSVRIGTDQTLVWRLLFCYCPRTGADGPTRTFSVPAANSLHRRRDRTQRSVRRLGQRPLISFPPSWIRHNPRDPARDPRAWIFVRRGGGGRTAIRDASFVAHPSRTRPCPRWTLLAARGSFIPVERAFARAPRFRGESPGEGGLRSLTSDGARSLKGIVESDADRGAVRA